jgi:type-F conjugative transfer system pilin assembly protein TrbC
VLRLLTGLAGVGLCAAAIAQTPTGDQAGAAAAARDALDQAGKLQQQRGFLNPLQIERDALRTAQPTANPQIGVGRQAPTPADLIDAIRNPPSQHWSETNQHPPLVLVSFSMPDADIRELARQAARIGAPLILSGLVGGTLTATQKKLAEFEDIPGASFLVDPTLFRRFKVETVPTFVLPLEELNACSQDGCPVPAHVKVSGESGLDHILDEVARRARDPRAKQLAGEMQAMLREKP